MTFLAKLKGALGLKPHKAERIEPEPPRKTIPKISARKRAYKATERALGAWEHMAAVKALPCICCGAVGPSEAHHVLDDKQPRSDFRVIPLCTACHRGPHGYHTAKKSWRAKYGRDCDLLPEVARLLKMG